MNAKKCNYNIIQWVYALQPYSVQTVLKINGDRKNDEHLPYFYYLCCRRRTNRGNEKSLRFDSVCFIQAIRWFFFFSAMKWRDGNNQSYIDYSDIVIMNLWNDNAQTGLQLSEINTVVFARLFASFLTAGTFCETNRWPIKYIS